MMNAIEQDIDLWEVWIEYDQFHPEYFGTLYVHGEMPSAKNSALSLIKINPDHSTQLILQLPARSSYNTHVREVMYSEQVKNLNQYSSICIYAGNELIGYFNDIEIMI
jgi:hypothetical protein